MIICTTAIPIIMGFFNNPVREKATASGFGRATLTFLIIILIGSYLTVSNILQQLPLITFKITYITAIMMLLPVLILIKAPLIMKSEITSIPLEDDPEADDSPTELVPVTSVEMTLSETIKTPIFWLIGFINMCLVGSSMMMVNNMVPLVLSKIHVTGTSSPIYRSSLVVISSFITIFSICHAFGRTIFNGLAEYYIYRFPKTFFLIFPALLLSLSLFGTAVSNVELFYVVMVTLGLSSGGVYGLIPSILSEIFGKRHLPSIEIIMNITSIIGVILFSQLLGGRLDRFFENESLICLKQSSTHPCVYYCNGSNCYFYTLISMAIMCFVITVFVVLLFRRLETERKKEMEDPETNEFLVESDLSDDN